MPDNKNDKKEALKTHKGKEDKSVANDMDRREENHYPRPDEAERQFNNQPEFTERRANRKDEEEA